MTDRLHVASPSAAASSQLAAFARFVEERTGHEMPDYATLHAFSTEQIERFWALFLDWSGALAEGDREPVVGAGMKETRFFPSLRTSWPENLLRADAAIDGEVAVVSVDETGVRQEVTRAGLRERVLDIARGLETLGVAEGDRVAAIVRNTLDTLAACLAATSLGATWSSLALDMGRDAALSRIKLLDPKVLLVHGSARQNGARLETPVVDFAGALTSLRAVVWLDEARDLPGLTSTALRDVEADGRARRGAAPDGPWRRFAFDHPLFVLFSSGTTGAPKGIVHGHGGTLLEHLKEHRLHVDLRPGDALCFQTSTGWMMWNWTVSALAAGARVVLYDGSVSHPERDSFLQVAARERVTVLGLSPAYLQYLVDAQVGGARERLRDVRLVLSTGSVLPPRLHRWAKEHLSAAPLESISGGTDILGCFVLGSPWSDTYEGESSCAGLGLDVRAWTDRGPATEGTGELVCVKPFPSRPVAFLKDPEGRRLHDAYYGQHPGAWTHGDLVEMTARGTVRVLGRCDGVLNIRGIRLGPSEIYEILLDAVPEVSQAMAVDADAPDEPGGKRLVLFVVLRGGVTLDRGLTLRVKRVLKQRASAVHVPAAIVAVDELPATYSNKLSEAALQDALSGRAVRNIGALRNPQAVQKAVEALAAQTRSDAGQYVRSA